jgi:hypothetical protein
VEKERGNDMNHTFVYYDYDNGHLVPMWKIVRLDLLQPDWSKALYLPLVTPFSRFEPEEFEQEISVSVLLSDLILHAEYHQHYGIFLPRVAQRVEAEDCSLSSVKLLVIRMADLEELIQMQRYHSAPAGL